MTTSLNGNPTLGPSTRASTQHLGSLRAAFDASGITGDILLRNSEAMTDATPVCLQLIGYYSFATQGFVIARAPRGGGAVVG